MIEKENNTAVLNRILPRQALAVVGWSANSLICPLVSNHQQRDSCIQYPWHWSENQPISSSTQIINERKQILFYPTTNAATQVILADRPLPNAGGRFYWEIYLPSVFGTSIMFGVATNQQTLTSKCQTNLIGIDQHGWALSNLGTIHHQGHSTKYLEKPLTTLKPVLVGIEFDSDRRTLSYTINNQPMGIAFHSIPRDRAIYPAVSSTSAHSTMILQHSCQLCSSLRDLCVRRVKQSQTSHENLPRHLIRSFF